ncbi:MAG: glycosyltransferase [Clostridia bacterium]|nr:glycosyltransferase [Clostridia bacterium]
MDEKLSVIVPCYNVENYIDRTLKCLINQTYKNIEIICVEDCSTDNTYEHLKKYENVSNIKIYKNEENKGLAYSRNFGVKHATAKYIGFIDSDDKVDNDYYEILMNELLNSSADVVVTDMLAVEDGNEENFYHEPGCIGEVNKINLLNRGMAASACNKVFNKDLLLKYQFMEGKINEDVASILPIIVKAKKIVYTDKTKYYYIQRKTSIQHTKITEKRLDIFDTVNCCLEYIKDEEKFEEYKQVILYHQILMLYFFVLPSDKRFFYRGKLLKKFMQKQEQYDLYNNKYGLEFLENCGKYSKIYYNKLLKCLKNSNGFFSNCYIQTYNLASLGIQILKKIYRKINYPIITKKNITINDLVNLAKKQAKIKENSIKVSVVIPNYNYENFLLERIYSVLYQTEKLHEVIILDDCSKDNSRILIDDVVDRLSKYINIKKEYNVQNTGSAFKQWQKGLEIAKGDYVWIAEADDYCDKNILKFLIKPILKNKEIYISYADTAFMDKNGKIFLKTIKPEIDLRKTNHWENDFINKGNDEIKNYTFLNCTIANVSSCIIKNENYTDVFEKATKYRQAGDWVFYANVMNKGYISYTNKVLNYYRVHGSSITSQMKKQNHLEEIKHIHKEMENLIEITDWHKDEFKKRYEFLKKAWKI